MLDRRRVATVQVDTGRQTTGETTGVVAGVTGLHQEETGVAGHGMQVSILSTRCLPTVPVVNLAFYGNRFSINMLQGTRTMPLKIN